MHSNCIFCKIARGEISCHKIYENKNFLAFLDINPVNKGHILVIPKEHCETILDCNERVLKGIVPVIKKVARKVREVSDGFNICINNFEAAGQLIKHFHIHIIPRFKNDGLTIDKQRSLRYKKGEIEKFEKKLKIKTTE